MPPKTTEEIVNEIDRQIVCDEAMHSSLRWLLTQAVTTLHQELQKAREEERERFSRHIDEILSVQNKHTDLLDWLHFYKTVLRNQSELDQPKN